MTASARAYGGRSAEERRAERRDRLLAAALDLWGEQGGSAVSVRGVCARAGLTDRYFYEAFRDRDALLVAVYERVEAQVLAALREGWDDWPSGGDPYTALAASFERLVGALAADPRIARVAAVGRGDGGALENRRRETLATVAHLVSAQVSAVGSGAFDVQAAAYFCAGGVGNLILPWLDGALELTAAQVADRCARLCAAVFGLRPGLGDS